ncbi:MAG TPA: peptidylprolyl isomerase [Thermodesulfobacteriota bacterium]|nr:peptidylprolyl isomerase [Thermodesulfobacteriota bacterium]
MNRTKNVFITVLCVIASLGASIAAAGARETIDRVVAIVNEDIITLSELRELALSINPTSTEAIDENAVLQQMIEQKLLEQQADKMGIKVTEAELDASIKQVQQKFGLNDQQMQEVLKKQNLTPESFREQWRLQTLSNKLLESQLKNKIVITEEEIQDYYVKNYGGGGTATESEETVSVDTQGGGEEVKIAHILISANTPDAEKKAEEVAEMAKSGKDFGELAKEYSEDKLSADKGGDLGYFKKGDLIETLEVAVDSTPVGGITGPVESPAGYHVIKVLERTGAEKAEKDDKDKDSKKDSGKVMAIDEDTRKEITEILYKQKAEAQLKTWLDKIKQEAYIEVRL